MRNRRTNNQARGASVHKLTDNLSLCSVNSVIFSKVSGMPFATSHLSFSRVRSSKTHLAFGLTSTDKFFGATSQ